MTESTCYDFDKCIKALADETRQEILRLLGQHEMCVSDLEALLAVQQPTVSHHLAVLHKANLVTIRREGRHVYYQTNAECVTECCGEIRNRLLVRPEDIGKEPPDHD